MSHLRLLRDVSRILNGATGKVVHEITTDPRFAGGRLARASRQELLAWLSDYHLTPG